MTGPYIPERPDLPINGLIPAPLAKADKRDEVDGDRFAQELKKQRVKTDTEQRNQRRHEEAEEAEVKAAEKKAFNRPLDSNQKRSVFDMETPKKRAAFPSTTKMPIKTNGRAPLLFLPSEGLINQEENETPSPEMHSIDSQETPSSTPALSVTLLPTSTPLHKQELPPTTAPTPLEEKPAEGSSKEVLKEEPKAEISTPLKEKETEKAETPPLANTTPATAPKEKKEDLKPAPLPKPIPEPEQEPSTKSTPNQTVKAPSVPLPAAPLPQPQPGQETTSTSVPKETQSPNKSTASTLENPETLSESSVKEVKSNPSEVPKEAPKAPKPVPIPPVNTESIAAPVSTPLTKSSRTEHESKKTKTEELTSLNGGSNPITAPSAPDDSTEDNKNGKEDEEDSVPILLKAPPVAFSSALEQSSSVHSPIGSFSSDMFLVFERISGITMVLSSRSKWPGDSETTFVIDEAILREAKLSSSIFLGCEITIITSAGAPNSFNVRLSGSPEAKKLFAEHKDKLEKAFKEKNFDVHIIETNIQL